MELVVVCFVFVLYITAICFCFYVSERSRGNQDQVVRTGFEYEVDYTPVCYTGTAAELKVRKNKVRRPSTAGYGSGRT